MLKIFWVVAIVTVQGPMVQEVADIPTFSTKEQCDAFGHNMVSRMEDWVRGALKADWGFPVSVTWRCAEKERDA